MATSGSVDFTMTRNQIIRAAARKIQAVRAGQSMGSEMITDFNQALNAMVKHWQGTGLHVWTVTEATLFPMPGQIVYPISTASSGSHVTESFVQTEISADEASGQTVLSVDSTTGMESTNYIGVTLDDGTIHWSTISGAPTSTTVTIASALTDSASEGNMVFAYASKIVRPLRIVQARSYDPETGEETEIDIIARKDYRLLANKTLAGQMNQIFYDPQLTTGQLYLYQTLATAGDLVKFTWWRPIQDFDAAGDNPDLPQEWIQALIFNLALVMAPEFTVPADTFSQIATMASSYLDDMKGWDREAESWQFEPDMED